MKKLKCNKGYKEWYYNKVSDLCLSSGAIWLLYDENKKFIKPFEYYLDLRNYVKEKESKGEF